MFFSYGAENFVFLLFVVFEATKNTLRFVSLATGAQRHCL